MSLKVTPRTTGSIHRLVSNATNAGNSDNADGIGGTPVCVTAPTTGDVLTFDGTEWCPAPPSGGGSSLPVFLYEDYGAVHDGVTDDTAAIQATWDAAEAAGGGVCTGGDGIYIIAGALQDTGRSNAQLLLPRRKVDSSILQITIYLLGQTPPPAIPSVVGTIATPVNGMIFKSTLSSGTGSMVGAWGPAGSSDDFTFLHATIENMCFRMVANPTNSGLDLSHVEAIELNNVTVDTGSYTVSSLSLETTATSFGLRTPLINNGAFTFLNSVNVIGFYNGIEVSEHTTADNVAVWGSRKAYNFPAAFHATFLTRIGAYHCIRGLVFTGSHYVRIPEFNIEHASSGTWVNVYDLDDASNFAAGDLRWHTVLAGTGVVSTFNVNGGTGMSHIEIGDNSGSISFATPAIVLGTAAAAGAASTVIRSDSTIVAFDATVPVTQAFGDVAATGSVAKAARRDHVHGMPASPTTGGEILISDTPSTPLIFADLIQNEAQTDLVYAG